MDLVSGKFIDLGTRIHLLFCCLSSTLQGLGRVLVFILLIWLCFVLPIYCLVLVMGLCHCFLFGGLCEMQLYKESFVLTNIQMLPFLSLKRFLVFRCVIPNSALQKFCLFFRKAWFALKPL